jgi:hypothetical protein
LSLIGIRALARSRVFGICARGDSEAGNSYFTVAKIAAARALVLQSHTHPLPIYRDVNFVWAFVLEETGPGTRLVMRARIRYTPVGPAPLIRRAISLAFDVGDVIQAGGMLEGIKRRAERLERGREQHRASSAGCRS